ILRYGSANLLLGLGAAALVIGGWGTWVVLALALVFGSFADEVSGDDDTSLKESRCGESLFHASAGQPFGISPGSFRRRAVQPNRAAVRNDRRAVADRLSLCAGR